MALMAILFLMSCSGGSPDQEGADVLSKLALSGGSAVVVLDDLVVERCAHADGATREVGVEVLSLPELDARWRITVSVQQMVDIILAAVPAQGDEAEVWGDGAVVGRGSSGIVGKWPGEVVGQLARPHEHVASLIWSIRGLDLLGLLLGLLLGVGDVHQVTVGQVPHRVASSANLLVHLVSTPDAGMVQRVKVATVRPGEVGSVQGQLSLHLLVKFVGHGTSNPTEQASSGQGGLFAKTHGSTCCRHHHSLL